MTSIKQASFPFWTGNDYPFYKVDFDYNFSKVQKIINLQTYLFLAVDEQFNLHFIQYRDPFPHEKAITPPSFALNGTGHIKFSLEYHTLKDFLENDNGLNNSFSWCFKDREVSKDKNNWFDNWPDVFYIGQDRLLIKLSSGSPTFIMHYDHRLESEKNTIIDWLKKGTKITPVDSSRIILYKKVANMVVLMCTLSGKIKGLNFTSPHGIDDIRMLTKLNIAIGTTFSNKTIEILDLRKNKIIEKIVLLDSSNQQIIVDEVDHSGTFTISYTKKIGRHDELILTIWRILADRTVQSSEELVLSYATNIMMIEFLNKDHIAIISHSGYKNDQTLFIYKLEERKMTQIYESTLNVDSECVQELNSLEDGLTYNYSCLKVLDAKTFVAVRARTDDNNSTDQQQIVIFNYTIGPDFAIESATQESEAKKSEFTVTTKVLISHAADKIIDITHWEDKFVVFLTRSKKLFCYNLQTR